MVFIPTNLLKSVSCPAGAKCDLTNCVFGHLKNPSGSSKHKLGEENVERQDVQIYPPAESAEPPHKRARLSPTPKDRTRFDSREAERHNLSGGKVHRSTSCLPMARQAPITPQDQHVTADRETPPTASRILQRAGIREESSSKVARNDAFTKVAKPAESLNPRMIAKDPVGHGKRSLYLKYLHIELCRLNKQFGSKSSATEGCEDGSNDQLDAQDLVQIALDEEEALVRDRPMVYPNRVKLRIAHMRKMSLPDWKQYLSTLQRTSKQTDRGAHTQQETVQTGLTKLEEALLLTQLVVQDQEKLRPFGYVPKPPTKEEAAEAAAAVNASRNYEICDRCNGRFRVFPNRDEQGSLTSNGACTYHPNKIVQTPPTKDQHYTGRREPYYPCCNASRGSLGCTESSNHVFKTTSPARLAAVLPFVMTPKNENPRKDVTGDDVKAITFDCEMGYTVLGQELIRLTAVSWPDGQTLLDLLVRPIGAIIDLNTRFSGIHAEHYANSIPYQQWLSDCGTTTLTSSNAAAALSTVQESLRLPLVSSPEEARALLCQFLTPSTPLIGHAIENDLNAVRLCHPTIVDTVCLFPHRKGLPLRLSLKALAAEHLHRSIQTAGSSGHDSFEDAHATGELVRVKIRDKWRSMQAKGWKINSSGLCAPARGVGKLLEEPSDVSTDNNDKNEGQRIVTNEAGAKEPLSANRKATLEHAKDMGVSAYLRRAKET